MILEALTLRNFCLFRGQQVFALAPEVRHKKNRPITLFGGINGGGKTTLFDAIQLALYGSRARCSKRSQLGYEGFLRQSIHHGVEGSEGAAVWLSFRYAVEGEERSFEVRRSWTDQEGKLRESLLVFQDGLPNNALGRDWPQLVEELIPLEISQLFFFDGEKIRALAEDATSSEALGAAIKALLGLDIVERLIADATVLQTRLAKQAGTPEHRAAVEGLETQIQELRGQYQVIREQRASLENQRLRAKKEETEAEDTFAASGGKHWETRQTREQRLAELGHLASELETQLVTLASSELPLALVPELLTRVREQDALERLAAESEIVQSLLQTRDDRLLAILREGHAPATLIQRVEEHLRADRQSRQPIAGVKQRLGLSEETRSRLRYLQDEKLPDLAGQAAGLVEKLQTINQERDDLERTLAATPADADIGSIVERLKTATQALTLLNDQAARLDADLQGKQAELAAVETRLRQFWQGKVEKEFAQEDARRLVGLAGRTRETMQEFLHRATEQKIDRLSTLITESFRYLLRKQTFVERVLIDPETFAITLYDQAGQALARQRLSEGEKQIFAISMLWGLARASARPLPAVIDTPMARLDATHRQHLVERYFPNASHQVIIFSTDTEVDRHYYELLQPAIARAYHLNYDEAQRLTVGEEGYFWKE